MRGACDETAANATGRLVLRSRLKTVVAASAVVSWLAACGSSTSPSSTSHSATQAGLSLTQLVAKGNAVCQTLHSEVHIGSVGSPAAINAAYIDKIDNAIDKETSGLAALKPDAAAAGQWNSYIAALKNDTAAYDAVRAKYDSHASDALQALEATSSNTESNRQGANLGLTSCVSQ
jgi:hypothetical protein